MKINTSLIKTKELLERGVEGVLLKDSLIKKIKSGTIVQVGKRKFIKIKRA